ncbi:MAG: RHS repeat protein, partial [Planctomycetales bacterium]|nr:RHS repeat protein [Planctomycetales bacterium]
LTEIHGSVQDDNLVSWTLDYTLASNVNLQIQQELLDESEIWKNIATGTTAKSNELLGTFDPTMILNNSYIIRLLAHDATGRSRAEGIFVAVTGETKIGNFRLEFTDLSLPLAGIPIDITRVYDTLQADTSGDFGFGWSQGGNDPHILETVPDGAEFAPGKTKVYLTNPEGRRVGFTYTETKILEGLLRDTKYRIEFKPDPGVYDRLTIDQTSITRGGLSGLATSIGQSLGGGGVLMNPDKYTLTTKDGLKYRYDQDTGIETITDQSGNVVTFSENAITHSSGTAITFDRDDQGRIDLIHFPTTDNDGNTITATIDYDYDANGDLIRFVDQSGKVTSYSYHEDLPHYLAEALDNQGDRLFKVVYDEDGRYQQVIDIDGNPVQTAEPPDLLARQAIVRDGNDNATTLFFDALGNVEREVDPLGNVTTREYKDPANPFLETKIIDRRGMVTERSYDARGNLKQIMELGPQDAPFAENVVTQFTYDTGNRVKSITNAAGQTTWFEYDGRGNLTKIVNAVGDFSTFTYDSEGRRASFTDFNGNTTTFDYTNACPCGSPSKVTFADGTYQVFSYNQYGQVTAEQYFEKIGTLVEQKYTYYDIQGRVTHEFDGEFTDGKWNQVRKFYDEDGNLDWEVILSPESTANTGVRLPGSNNLIAELTQTKEQLIAEGKSRVTDYEYDNRNRLIRQIDAEGGVAEFHYDNEGNRILLQDPVGNI